MHLIKKRITLLIHIILSLFLINSTVTCNTIENINKENFYVFMDQFCMDIKKINKQLLLIDELCEVALMQEYEISDDFLMSIHDSTIALLKRGQTLLAIAKKYQLTDEKHGKLRDYLAKKIALLQKNATRLFARTNVFPGVLHADVSGIISSNLIVDADIDAAAAIVDTKLATISTAGKIANSATTATNSNITSAIVARDTSGNFSAGTITANLSGNATTATSATTSTNFSGSLSGDVTGTQGSTVVSTVGGQIASSVAATVTAFAAATSSNVANTLVVRDATGNIAVQTMSAVDDVVSENIFLNDSTSSSIGNIVKNGTTFIHNFGTSNTFAGEGSGNFTMSGSGQNTGIGKSALVANATGESNTAIGFSALTANTTGSQNTALGANTGTGVTTGNNNVMVGYNVAASTTTGSNNIYIDGNGLSPANESNAIRIGGTQTTCFVKGISGTTVVGGTVLVTTSGQLGTLLSSRKFKDNIRSMNNESEKIHALNPVLFTYKSDKDNVQQYGLIAEEVDHILPDLVIKDEEEQPYTVRYDILPILLLKEAQKNKIIVDDLISQIIQLKETIIVLTKEINIFKCSA